MNRIKLSVNANRLTVTTDCYTTGGSINYDECEFTFNNEWTGFTKTAVFSSTGNDAYRVNIVNNVCKIPAICIEKAGILRIGVFGMNDDDVVITTNTVAHRVEEGTDGVGEWIEEDNTLVVNAINEMKSSVEDFKNGLNNKFAELLKKVDDETEIKFEGYLPDWYNPPVVFDAEDIPLPSKNSEYTDYLSFKLDKLRTDFPSYVQKNLIGYDTSDDYGLFSYVFNPGTHHKSIFISACVHGTDRSALMALSYFLDNLCRNRDDKILNYIRNNIKLYVIPVVNPYGLENSRITNSEDVNIGYNFPYKWTESTYTKKGESSADQLETQNVISYLNQISSDNLCAAIDLHTNSVAIAGRTVIYPKNQKNCASILAEVVNDFNYKSASTDIKSKAVLVPSVNPSLTNYIADQFKINACELVWHNTTYGGESANNTYTKYVEFFGNVLYKLALNSKASTKEKPQPFTKYLSWKKSTNTDVFTIPNSQMTQNMGISAYVMKLDMPCNIVMNGYVVLNVSSACTVKINPLLYQVNSTEQNYYDRRDSEKFIVELSLTAGTHVIPLSSVLQGYYTSYNHSDDTSYCENVKFVLAFTSSVPNVATVTAYSVTLNAFPSDRAVPVEISSPMGLVEDYSENEVPTQTLVFPLRTVNVYDRDYRD